MSWYPFWYKGTPQATYGGTVRTAALLQGSGTSAAPTSTATAGKNFLGYWVKSTAASGDARGLYMRLYLEGAGSGEAVRAYATANAAGVAAGGTINGIHASLSIAASASVSGAGNAIRATLDAAADTRTLAGTLAAIQLDSNIATGNTVPANAAFIRVTDTGAVKLAKLFNLPASASGAMVAPHTTQVMTDSIRVVLDDGSIRYIMLTTASSNRTGGA